MALFTRRPQASESIQLYNMGQNQSVLLVGLGNVGRVYEGTRHNVGFFCIDHFVDQVEEMEDWILKKDLKCHLSKGRMGDKQVIAIKPTTFMNLSGEAVSCFAAKHHLVLPAETLVVISDDLALPLGKIRIRERGSAGGHNGLKSIISALSTNEFVRLRMGIQPDHPISDPKRFVLDRFPSGERVLMEEMIEQAAQAVRTIVREGALKAMQEFN